MGSYYQFKFVKVFTTNRLLLIIYKITVNKKKDIDNSKELIKLF